MSRTLELIAGVLLLLIGLLLIASEPISDFVNGIDGGEEVLRWWPMLLIGLSLYVLVPALVGGPNRRLRAGMVIPGALLAGVGGALLYSSLTDHWDAWAYLWSVIPFSFGLGMYAAGWIADAPAFEWIGSALAIGGVVAYLVFATTFGGEAFRLVAAIGILALGAALTVGGLAERLSRKSPS